MKPVKIIGSISGNETIITQPEFEASHLDFLCRYLCVEAVKKAKWVVVKKKVSKERLEMFVKAYLYEFGKW